METYTFLQELPISYLHVFTYSERPNTTALRIKGRIPGAIRNDRNRMLTILSEKKRRAFYESQLGNTFNVLWEIGNHEGWQHGFTENYLKVKGPYSDSNINIFSRMSMSEIDGEGVILGS